jgi:regulator of replication initiation timing
MTDITIQIDSSEDRDYFVKEFLKMIPAVEFHIQALCEQLADIERQIEQMNEEGCRQTISIFSLIKESLFGEFEAVESRADAERRCLFDQRKDLENLLQTSQAQLDSLQRLITLLQDTETSVTIPFSQYKELTNVEWYTDF